MCASQKKKKKRTNGEISLFIRAEIFFFIIWIIHNCSERSYMMDLLIKDTCLEFWTLDFVLVCKQRLCFVYIAVFVTGCSCSGDAPPRFYFYAFRLALVIDPFSLGCTLTFLMDFDWRASLRLFISMQSYKYRKKKNKATGGNELKKANTTPTRVSVSGN